MSLFHTGQNGASLPSRMEGARATQFQSTGQLEKEDYVILFLSLILIVATLWLASYVL